MHGKRVTRIAWPHHIRQENRRTGSQPARTFNGHRYLRQLQELVEQPGLILWADETLAPGVLAPGS